MNTLNLILLDSQPNLAEQFLIAAAPMVKGIVTKSLTFVPLMLFVHVLITLTKAYFGDMRIDPSAIIKVICIWILLAAYEPTYHAVSESMVFFNSLVSNSGPGDIMSSLNSLSETAYLKKHTKEFAFANVKIPFDDATSFFTWLVLAVENGLAMVVRLFIERIRSILIAYIFVCGPVALLISTIPGFGGTIAHWFRIFLSTAMWQLTLGILDTMMMGFIQNFTMPTGSTLQEASGVLDLLVVNGAVILMYLSVPLLTSFYIGGAASASFLAAAQGAMGAATAAAGGVVNGAASKYRKSHEREKRQEEKRKKEHRTKETVE